MRDLAGKRILVVEDDWVLADEIARALEQEGAQVVGPAPNLDHCLQLIASDGPLDGAVLDINLRGTFSYPAADALAAKGVPHIFLTGYDGGSIPRAYRDVRRFEKPLDPRRAIAALFTDQETADDQRG